MTLHSVGGSELAPYAFGDRLRAALGILDFLKDFDLSKLDDLREAWGRMAAADDFRVQVEVGIDMARILASMTPTEADDRAVAWLDTISQSDVIGIIERIVKRFVDGADSPSDGGISLFVVGDEPGGVTPTEIASVEAMGLPIPVLLEVARLVAEVILRLRRS